jgi:hypothetical protein
LILELPRKQSKTLVLGLCSLPPFVGSVFGRFWWAQLVGWPTVYVLLGTKFIKKKKKQKMAKQNNK